MQAPDNAWQEMWENAKPVPARRQKRLFDDTKEAEKAIQYLANLRPGEFSQLMVPAFLQACVHRLLVEPFDFVPAVHEVISTTIPILVQLSRLPCRPEVQHFNNAHNEDFERRKTKAREVSRRLAAAETTLSQALSLRAKFLADAQEVTDSAAPDDKVAVGSQMEAFVRQLYTSPEVNVIGASRGPAGQLIRKMFAEAMREREMITEDMVVNEEDIFPAAYSREYIIRSYVPRPRIYSAKSPQRLYLCIKRNEFRMAGAFTIDTESL